ncbi:MAG: hypothetical protein HYX78_09510 [Armatimonadetes bacterium]|nr:hypothetical protein [Armatimonadota bacterium]
MRLRNLKWLTLLAPLGLLGWAFDFDALWGLFGFSVFSPLFGADERAENNLGRAAAVGYTLTLAMLVSTLLLTGIGQAMKWEAGQFLQMFGIMLAITYGLHVTSLMIVYAYYEHRGV